MWKQTKVAAIVLAVSISVASAQPKDGVYSIEPGSALTLLGTSTLHDFTCDVAELRGSIRASDQNNGPASGRSLVPSHVHISIPVKSIKSGSASMDENMWEALKADQHPVIEYQLFRSEIIESQYSDTVVFRSVGQLTVAGTSKEIEVQVIGAELPNGLLRFEGSKKLLMTDFGVKPPSLMFGAIKTGNEITVRFNLLVKPAVYGGM